MAKSDPVKDNSWQRFEHAVDAAVKSGPKHKIGKRKAPSEPKERPASKGRIPKDDWLVAPLKNGCMCLNLVDAGTVFVEILQLSESRVKGYLNDFDGGARDLCVFHFPIGGD